MNLQAFEKRENFFTGLKTLFAALHVPVNYIAEQPIAPHEILSQTFKTQSEAYQLMDDVFVLGMVDQAAFEGKTSAAIAGIAQGQKDYDGLLIFGVTLKDRANGLLPTRRQLAEITRAFNREFHYTPVVVVFRYAQFISIANAERMAYAQDWREGEKVGKVSLLRDIHVTQPHAGHLKILQELAIRRTGKGAVNTFADLYAYWQSVFNVALLNKQFYKELSDWYFWALQEVMFPAAADLPADDEQRKAQTAQHLIRLLTRLLFVWFVKEKHLIPAELFDEAYLTAHLLNGFQPRKRAARDPLTRDSQYYRAVLQNLFFATLNQTAGQRAFRKPGQQMNVTNLMRYKGYFNDPAAFIALVEAQVPFMNGGLFECLDAPDPARKGRLGGDVIVYADGFSDRPDNPLCVPDYVFFGGAEHADLSAELGDQKRHDVSVNGLINILNSYKFTVTENTPIEEDVALDPELLGRVFENLLASFNPETKTTARKQTGSFYTPREIVNYMVDESLIAYLMSALPPTVGAGSPRPNEGAETRLRMLLDYDAAYFQADHRFDDTQTAAIIAAIDRCKILDPACGSGAFPMGILHKLVHVLHKLDPQNERWRELQRQKALKDTEAAFRIGNQQERDNRLKEISDVFEHNSDDYGRKLYLLENCIYGVDIQPIAAQISKLRCFIALIVDQRADPAQENFGIRPLPNLETKFVAANTLIGIEKPKTGDFVGGLFDNRTVKALEEQLKEVRHRLFSARTPAKKRELRAEDQKLRENMGALLVDAGWGNETARQLAAWDPYNQNASSPFFDPEWMFGVRDGFDIVIGNPPYSSKQSVETKRYTMFFDFVEYKCDPYAFFIELGYRLLKKSACLAFITPVTWMTNYYYAKLRSMLIKSLSLKQIVLINGLVFENANVDTCLLFVHKEAVSSRSFEWICTSPGLENPTPIKRDYATIEQEERLDIMPAFSSGWEQMKAKMDSISKQLGTISKISLGMKLQKNDLFVSEKQDSQHPDPIFFGRDIALYGKLQPTHFFNFKTAIIVGGTKKPEVHYAKPKIFVQAIRNLSLERRIVATLDTEGSCFIGTVNAVVLNNSDYDIRYVLGILNSNLLNTYFRNRFTTISLTASFLGVLPIRDIKTVDQKQVAHLIALVDQILAAKQHNPAADTRALEADIDQRVYALYGLTEEEIAIVEGKG